MYGCMDCMCGYLDCMYGCTECVFGYLDCMFGCIDCMFGYLDCMFGCIDCRGQLEQGTVHKKREGKPSFLKSIIYSIVLVCTTSSTVSCTICTADC